MSRDCDALTERLSHAHAAERHNLCDSHRVATVTLASQRCFTDTPA